MPCTLRLFVPKSRNNCNGICCVKYFICSCQRSVRSCSAVSCMERVWSKPVARSALKHAGSRSAGQYTWCKEMRGCSVPQREAAGWGRDRSVTQWRWRLAAPLVCAGGRLCKRLQFSRFWAKQAGVSVLFAISFANVKADWVCS